MIGKGETELSVLVIIKKKHSRDMNGCNRMKKESGREREEHEEKEEEEVCKR
jgi:hypothetical protein